MGRNNQNKLIIILIAVILVLGLIMAYAFLIKPSINGYVISKQSDAANIILSTMLTQIEQQGYTQIVDAEGNAIILVPYVPEQVQEQPQG